MESKVHEIVFDPETSRPVLPIDTTQAVWGEVEAYTRGQCANVGTEAQEVLKGIFDAFNNAGLLDAEGVPIEEGVTAAHYKEAQ